MACRGNAFLDCRRVVRDAVAGGAELPRREACCRRAPNARLHTEEHKTEEEEEEEERSSHNCNEIEALGVELRFHGILKKFFIIIMIIFLLNLIFKRFYQLKLYIKIKYKLQNLILNILKC